jgi:predicted MFS family arabinose efflux permease
MFPTLLSLPHSVKQYLIITTNYWFFTLTDGALRMLVLLYFYQLGYQPMAIAMLFVFYEVFGVITNLVGGWLGARIGLNKTMQIGMFLQIFALLMLSLPIEYLSMMYVMTAQALSGIAKDLNKMSAKSSVKLIVNQRQENDQSSRLFKWVALLTGSKNTLKGIGFFLGGLLLTLFGFSWAVLLMAMVLLFVAILSLLILEADLGKTTFKAKFTDIFSTNPSLNYLSAARLCLFASRDVWFVIALPVYLSSQLGWSHQSVGSFLAIWIVFYGMIQASTPFLLGMNRAENNTDKTITGFKASLWALYLGLVVVLMISLWYFFALNAWVILIGLFLFGFVFAINSTLHSYLIVALARDDGVSMDVGFYYMANALGRLLGTILSGWIYQEYGLISCLLCSTIFILLASYFVKNVRA